MSGEDCKPITVGYFTKTYRVVGVIVIALLTILGGWYGSLSIKANKSDVIKIVEELQKENKDLKDKVICLEKEMLQRITLVQHEEVRKEIKDVGAQVSSLNGEFQKLCGKVEQFMQAHNNTEKNK